MNSQETSVQLRMWSVELHTRDCSLLLTSAGRPSWIANAKLIFPGAVVEGGAAAGFTGTELNPWQWRAAAVEHYE